MESNRLYFYISIAALSGAFLFISLLVYFTRGKPQLIKKKLLIGGLLLSLTGTAMNCKQNVAVCYSEPYEPQYRIGWADNNTYRTNQIASANQVLDYRRRSCRRNALKGARNKILKEFLSMINIKTKNKKLANDIVSRAKIEFKRIIKNGKISKIIYTNNDECEIIYEIKEKNLKQKILNYSQTYKLKSHNKS